MSKTKGGAWALRHADGLWPNALALGAMLAGWIGGVLLMALGPAWAWPLGVLLTAEGLVLAAYYLHEFAHHAIFATNVANERLGLAMTWITGSCYARFGELRFKHMRHHIDRADVVTFEYKAFLARSPRWVGRMFEALEWAYVPAVELLMHGYVMLLPFLAEDRRPSRGRVLGVLAVRVAAFALLGWWSLPALLGYAVAYCLMLHVLRFVDAYQHTYDAVPLLAGGVPHDPKRDRAYEQRNTYSNVVSAGHPLLNLLLLNFPYHNAHHERPVEPWYRLPALHARLYPQGNPQVIPMRELIGAHHRYRVVRLRSDDYGDVVETPDGRLDASGFYGAVGVSFLTAV
ncbi:fatty acid desaturase family protein [Derxia lacustris]|uniref:fatty acid desaturase family protein n=1 Tax=Derxia lacustris TaxID=764842 RepID=UPI000A171FF4|nr:fatty acid desaturase [Derxia lacustris]